MMMCRPFLLFMILASTVSAAAPDYLTEIKPLLASRCFDCHGGLKQKAKLRVDTAAAMLESEIIIPGKPDASELIYRISSTEPDERMPPEHEGSLFTAKEVQLIHEWIAAGAVAPDDEQAEAAPEDHWAFQRITRPALPDGNATNPIDAFLNAKIISNGLTPQPQAERSTLLRRLYLDLLGLPPTEAQLQDTRGYELIVDELLASPHHGERWGRHWMDVWRYSDWYGLGAQLRYSQKHIWRWRDWIVQSINSDKGYDRMILEMLAGDELDPDNPDVVAGTGFLARNYYLFNRTTWLDSTIEHSGKAFLGLTMNCAKCHDHKYDPISHVDYYNYRAFFEPHQIRLDAVEGQLDFNKDGLPRAFDDQPDAKTVLHRRGNPSEPDNKILIEPRVPALFASFATEPQPIALPASAWAPGTRPDVQRAHVQAAEAKIKKARKELASAKAKPADEPEENATPPAPPGLAFADEFERARPEDWDVVGEGWRYQGGSLVQLELSRGSQYVRSRKPHPTDFELALSFRTTGGDMWKSVGFRFDVSEDGQNAHTLYASAHAPNPKVQLAHKKNGQPIYPPRARVARQVPLNVDHTLAIKVRNNLANAFLNDTFLFAYQLPDRRPGGRIELFAFDATAEFEAIRVTPLAADVALQPAKGEAGTPQSPTNAVELAEARLAEADASLTALHARIAADQATMGPDQKNAASTAQTAAKLEKKHALAKAQLELLLAAPDKRAAAKKKRAVAETALGKSDSNYTPLRGSFKALETPEHKEPQYAATYNPTSTGRRLALAQWMTARDNPLTARVAVNHIWLRHFGAPLVDSTFDFGRRSPRPEHAELLDHLAVELIESGWSMKHLHRLMVTSAAWQRSASNLGADPDTFATDKTNRFYWRMNSRRMESQVLRDSLVHLAGALDFTMGGPSIAPSPNARRRSLYFKHSRDQQSPWLATFDDAEILACYRRMDSIVPQQALAMANSTLTLEMSKKLASAAPAAQSNVDFARTLFFRILCRAPTEAELKECVDFLKTVPNRTRLVQALFNHNDFVMIR